MMVNTLYRSAPFLGEVHQIPPYTHLMKGFHHTHHVVEDDNGLALAQSFLLYNVMLEVYKICRLVAEVMSTQAVEHEADSLLHLAHFVGLHVLHYFVGSILWINNKEKCEQLS